MNTTLANAHAVSREFSFNRGFNAPSFAYSRSGSASLRAPLNSSLTLEQIKHATPSVFAEQRHESRSEKYVYIPTSVILERLMREGFQPVSVVQGGSRDEAKKGFTKHAIRLRHVDLKLTTVDQIFTEICLWNSHDGTSAYGMNIAPFRIRCLNGLVVKSGDLDGMRVPHKGDIAGQVIDGCISIMGQAPELADSIRGMESLQLSPAEQQIFANAAHRLRYDEPALAPIKPVELLRTRRDADRASDVWTTFNVIQENVIKGGIPYVQTDTNGRRVARRETRPINGIDQNTNLNRALWQLAEEMKALKAAG